MSVQDSLIRIYHLLGQIEGTLNYTEDSFMNGRTNGPTANAVRSAAPMPAGIKDLLVEITLTAERIDTKTKFFDQVMFEPTEENAKYRAMAPGQAGTAPIAGLR